MIFQRFSVIAAAIIVVCCLFLLVSRNWRQSILAFAVLYIGVFWLTALVWPVGLAVVKLVVGWMAGAVLGATIQTETSPFQHVELRPVQIFRLTAGAVVIVLVFALESALLEWIAIDPVVLWGAMVLIGMGVLQLGIMTNPFNLFVGLLILLAGFETIYAVLESSVLVAGLLAVVNLGLALTGAYLISSQAGEETA
ncbi:MAG: hypothetical protein IT308_01430 [Anaerolineaceae bacterium]|nr:hypothetical protein [Anaerolineaceae bacterium]